MTAENFYKIVRKMRQMQQVYATSRAPSAEHECRLLERIIDDEIKRVDELMRKRMDQRLGL